MDAMTEPDTLGGSRQAMLVSVGSGIQSQFIMEQKNRIQNAVVYRELHCSKLSAVRSIRSGGGQQSEIMKMSDFLVLLAGFIILLEETCSVFWLLRVIVCRGLCCTL